MRPSSTGAAPTVLFIDEFAWDCFFQLAAGLRSYGFRTVRATLAPPNRLASALCFDRTIRLAGPSSVRSLPDQLADENVVDIQVVEALAMAATDTLWSLPPTTRRAEWARRMDAVDKPAVLERLRAGGLSTPPTVAGADVTAEEIASALGLPVVHKPRVASSGDGLSVLHSVGDVEALLQAGRHTSAHVFERYVTGRHIQFAAVLGPDGSGPSVTYETLGRKGQNGPASQIRCLDDETLDATGRKVAADLGIVGLININVIRDSEGGDWIHDINPRVWGSFVAFRAVGVDFLRTYVDLLAGRALACSGRRRCSGTELAVFPGAFRTPRSDESRWHRNGRFLRQLPDYRRWVGTRYAAYELACQAAVRA